jgi:hypothetical protein
VYFPQIKDPDRRIEELIPQVDDLMVTDHAHAKY